MSNSSASSVETSRGPLLPEGADEIQPAVLVVGTCPKVWSSCQAASPGLRCQVLEAPDAEDAQRLLRSGPVAVLIACQQTTTGGGIALLAWAQTLQPECVGILVSRQVSPELAEEAATRAQAFRLLLGPVEKDDLTSALRAALDRAVLNRTRGHGEPCAETDGDRGRTRGLLENLLPRLPTAQLKLDATCRVVSANPAAHLALGKTENRLRGLHATEVGVPCFRDPEDNSVVTRSLCGNRDLSRVQCWGQERTLLWSCEALSDTGGEHRGCDVSFADVTDRDQIDISIFLAKHEIEGLFDSITDPTMLVDPQFRVRRANREFAVFVDRAFADLLGEPCPALLQHAGGERLEAGLGRVFQSGRRGNDEVELPDGRTFKIHLFPIVRAGRVRQVVVRYQDVSEEKAVEVRLLQAQKLASIGRLSAGIAHEINNPVGFISWNINQLGSYLKEIDTLYHETREYASRALAGDLDAKEAWSTCLANWERSELPLVLEDAGDIVTECNQGVERVQKIVRDLRSYSHPNAQDWELADLHECVESAVTIVWNEIKHRCDLRRNYGELPKIRCVPQRLIQVFMNLLVNAAHAVGTDGRVTLRTNECGDGVTVEVLDTGCGMDPALINKVFDPFFTTKGVGEGTGLGLYLARRIVEEHRGEIHIVSKPQEGSCFTVRLPVGPTKQEYVAPAPEEIRDECDETE